MSETMDHEMLIVRLTESRQWDRLLQAARDWLGDDPEAYAAQFAAGNALIQLDRPKEALPHLEQVIVHQPSHVCTHRLLATAHFDLGNHQQADRSILEAIRLGPNDFSNWYELARMCHLQHDTPNALKWATRALELAPNDPDVVNLYAVCGGQLGAMGNSTEAVLAIDPEHALAHNNLGTDHLNAGDYRKAEECFRRALAIDPMLRIARENLLHAVKHRDTVYRVLCAPRDFLRWITRKALGKKGQKRNIAVFAVGIVLWILVARFVLVASVLWLVLGWPMLKFYEFLVIGDLRKKAGEIGTKRGGFLGYRRWPLGLRLAIFGAGLAGFWIGAYVLIGALDAESETRTATRVLLFIAVFTAILVHKTSSLIQQAFGRFRSLRRERLLKKTNTRSR